MGYFLTASFVAQQATDGVTAALRHTAQMLGGDLEAADLEPGDTQYCAVHHTAQGCFIRFPDHFYEQELFMQMLSERLQAMVGSFSVHDDDYWTVQLLDKGALVSVFQSAPAYPGDEVYQEDTFDLAAYAALMKCPADAIAQYFTNRDNAADSYAYTGDAYRYGDALQLIDLLQRSGISKEIVLQEDEAPQVFRISTANYAGDASELTIEDLRQTKRYQPGTMHVTEGEMEAILKMPFAQFDTLANHNQICLSCEDFDATRLHPSYALSVDSLTLNIHGSCASCGAAMDAGWGLTDLQTLKEFLNK